MISDAEGYNISIFSIATSRGKVIPDEKGEPFSARITFHLSVTPDIAVTNSCSKCKSLLPSSHTTIIYSCYHG